MASLSSLFSFAPIVSPHTEILILGSFPGVQSLQKKEYYAHPKNHFWKIIKELYPGDYSSYDKKCENLLAAHLGLWDIYAQCEREGSLDSAIKKETHQNFQTLKSLAPNLKGVIHNGKESFKSAPLIAEQLNAPSFYAPSTSAANAQWSYQQKLEVWKDLITGIKNL